MSNDNQKDTAIDGLICNLSKDLKPVKRLRHPMVRAAVWILFALSYTTLFVAIMGPRHDFMEMMMGDMMFVTDIAFALAISLTAGLAAAWMCVPDMRGQKWLVGVPITLMVFFVALLVARAAMADDMEMTYMNIKDVAGEAILFATVPALAVIYFTSCGNTTRPVTLALMAALSVGMLGWAGMRCVCGADMLAHVLLYHALPFALIGTVVGLVAMRAMRW